MWNKPSQEELAKLPPFYSSEPTPIEDKIIYMHFFLGSADWYVAEFDGQDTFFGFVNLGDPMNAEWGTFSLQELDEINIGGIEVDRELHWQPTKFSEIVKKPGG